VTTMLLRSLCSTSHVVFPGFRLKLQGGKTTEETADRTTFARNKMMIRGIIVAKGIVLFTCWS